MDTQDGSDALHRMTTKHRFLTFIAVVFCTAIWLSNLSKNVYLTFTEHALTDEGSLWFWNLLLIHFCLFWLGYKFGPRCTRLQGSESRQECLDSLNKMFKSRPPLWRRLVPEWRARNTFDAYLYGLYYSGRILDLSRWHAGSLTVSHHMAITMFLRVAVISYFSPECSFADLGFGISVTLLASASLLGGWIIGWHAVVGDAARKIEERCRKTDVEKAGNEQEELRWWFEAVKKRYTDACPQEEDCKVEEISGETEKQQHIEVTCVEVPSDHDLEFEEQEQDD